MGHRAPRRTRVILIAFAASALIGCLVAAALITPQLPPGTLWRPLPPGVTRHSLEVDGQRRTYLLYLPPSRNPGEMAPLVLSLHGFSSWPAHQMFVSAWNPIAEQHGIVVAYPAGRRVPLRWGVSPRAASPAEAEEDLAFLSQLIDTLIADHNLDASRVYVTGLSNGGGMANRLACDLPGRLAGMGTVAGAYYEPAAGCNPAWSVPLIAFHGTGDPIVPYPGGIDGAMSEGLLPVEDWAANWAGRNGCDIAPQALPAVGDIRGAAYTNCREDADVVLYTVDGGGHSWPGGGLMPRFIVGETSMALNASEVMWAFFEAHAR